MHFSVLHGHEERVDDDAQRYEEIDEGVHDEELDEVCEPVPGGRALPAEQQQHTLLFDKLFLVHPFLVTEQPCKRSRLILMMI